MKQTIKNFLLRKILLKKGIKVLKNKKGFSLIEIMVALGLLVVIGGIAVPQYNEYRATAKKQAVNSTISQIEQAVATCVAIEQDPAGCFGAYDNDTKTFVNKTLKTKSGIGIVRKTGASTSTCYWVYENAGANPAQTTSAVPQGKYFGSIQFINATGAKKDETPANTVASSSQSISCTDPTP